MPGKKAAEPQAKGRSIWSQGDGCLVGGFSAEKIFIGYTEQRLRSMDF
jgi:hypothetical protein